ncbi:MAG: hypothetical protein M1831_000572 [Alyxoria varia]|nr:MAG: hypothetical protein M1831_000572 [Alyxoria varia]
MASPSTPNDNKNKDASGQSPPLTPDSASPSPATSPALGSPVSPSSAQRPSPPAQSHSSNPALGMTSSSTALGNVNAARRPGPPQATMSQRSALPSDLQAKMKAFHLGRQGAPPAANARAGSPLASNINTSNSPTSAQPAAAPQSPVTPSMGPGGVPTNFRTPPRPGAAAATSSPDVTAAGGKPSLAQKRGLALPGGLPGSQPAGGAPAGGGRGGAGGKKKPGLTLSQMNPGSSDQKEGGGGGDSGSLMDKYSDIIDKKTGALRFKGKATLTPHGVEFSSGGSFNISLDEVDTLDELGKGNYGTVFKVRHSRPRVRKPGQGLAGNKPAPGQLPSDTVSPSKSHFSDSPISATPTSATSGSLTGVVMAMKEIRLELDDAKFAAIIMELDILHRCVSPFIVDFYGAFFQEGAVYICIEFMDGGSIDKLYGDGIPEGVLRKITLSTTLALKALKDEHNIIHRDVKPTNILINTRGQIKICDFGVSGNLVASIARTNIGCQSYMAPERIKSGGVAQAGANPGGGTYSVQSDIWSLGLTIIECALGQYPYPPETYDNIFSQLSAIVDGEPPDLPATFSEAAHDFVRGCLMKIPKLRPTYAMLLQHGWLAPLLKPPTISEDAEEEAAAENTNAGTGGGGAANPASASSDATADKEIAEWVAQMLERRRNGTIGKKAQPALHAAPLDAMPSPAAGGGGAGGG